MKKIFIQLIFLVSLTTITQFVVQAQTQSDRQKEKTALYDRFLEARRNGVTSDAYKLAKEYLEKFTNDGDVEIVTYLKAYVARFEPDVRDEFTYAFLRQEYKKVFSIGKEILKDEPDNLRALLFVSYAGFKLVAVSHDSSYKPETINYAKRALNVINADTKLTIHQFFKNRVGALAWMNFIVGYLIYKDEPLEAIRYIYESVQDEPSLKEINTPYGVLGRVYISEYKKAENDSAISPNKKNAFLECAIDAFARAHVYSVDPHLNSMWLEELTYVYKKRYGNNATGLSDYIKQIKNKPMCKLEQ